MRRWNSLMAQGGLTVSCLRHALQAIYAKTTATRLTATSVTMVPSSILGAP